MLTFMVTSTAACSQCADERVEVMGITPPVELAQQSLVQESESKTLRLSFVGDLAMTSKVGRRMARNSRGLANPVGSGADSPLYPFAAVSKHLRAADLLVGNLECLASPLGAVAIEAHPLRCPEAVLGVLGQAGFDVLSVANNHGMDFGRAAFADMLGRIQAAGLDHVGSQAMLRRAQPALVRVVDGIRVGLLAYFRPPAKTLSDVHAARPQVDVLVVYNHWGIEDRVAPLPQQRELAHRLINAGVDLVVGSHAHVVQPLERYRGKLIAYGLGNFVFDAMALSEPRRRGALLEVQIDSKGQLRRYRLLHTRANEQLVPVVVRVQEWPSAG